jgi:hypothetical protein
MLNGLQKRIHNLVTTSSVGKKSQKHSSNHDLETCVPIQGPTHHTFDSLIKTVSSNCKMHNSYGINIMDHAELSNDMKSQIFYATI